MEQGYSNAKKGTSKRLDIVMCSGDPDKIINGRQTRWHITGCVTKGMDEAQKREEHLQ